MNRRCPADAGVSPEDRSRKARSRIRVELDLASVCSRGGEELAAPQRVLHGQRIVIPMITI